ncbi:MAG: CHAT domain-containing protein, partial [Hassallia sp.]
WTALAYTKPGEAAREIASTLAALKLEEKAEWVRMASVVETFAEPLAGFEPLLIYSRGMASFVRGKTTKAVTELSQLAKAGDKLKVAGLNLPIPESLIRQIEENSESTQHSGDRLGFDSVPEEPAQVKSPHVKKILILAANPKGMSRLRLDEEVREIELGLQRGQKRDQFVIKSMWAVRPIDFQRAMLDVKPEIVHFSGHGVWDGGLKFEDEKGQVKFVDAEGLAALFKLFAWKVECVVLNACYSEIQAEAIAQHINYVIGMNAAMGHKAAIEFAVGFYDALGADRSYEDAYKFGCLNIDLEGIPESSTPVLKTRKSQIKGNSIKT